MSSIHEGAGDGNGVSNMIIPLPNWSLGQSDQYEIEHVNLSNMLASDLKNLVKNHNLRVAGQTKAAYIRALQVFSSDKSTWHKMRHVSRRPHKGSRNIAQASKSTKQSKRQKLTSRRDEMVSQLPAVAAPSNRYHNDIRTTTPAMSLRQFTRNIMQMCQAESLNSLDQTTQSVSHQKDSAPIQSPLGRELQPGFSTYIQSQSQKTVGAGPASNRGQAVAVENLAIQGPLHFEKPQAAGDQPYTPCSLPINIALTLHGETTALTTRLEPPTESTAASFKDEDFADLYLGDGLFRYLVNDVPPMPTDFFQRDLAILNKMWDDVSDSWCGTSPLSLRGEKDGVLVTKPIAPIYWSKVYRYRKPKIWYSSGQSWRNYESLIGEYRLLQPDDFWKRYSDNGHRFSLWTIIKVLNGRNAKNGRKKDESSAKTFGSREGGSAE